MSFKRWFKWWLRSFSAVMFFGQKKHKSEWQRKEEKRKRREYERRRHTMNYTVKERKKARSSNAILLEKVGNFFVASLAFLLVPVGLFKRAKKAKKTSIYKAKNASKNTSKSSSKSSVNSSQKEVKKESKTDKKVAKNSIDYSKMFASNLSVTREKTEVKREKKKEENKPILQESVHVASLKIDDKKDENSPKTSPKNTNDTWIRKRMIAEMMRGEMVEKINIGDTFDLALADDKSVVLTRQNSPVATVRKADTLALATALKLGRKLYAVVVDVKSNEIEFEGWQR